MGRPKKNANKDEEADSIKLPWTDDMNLVLLKLVQHHGAHLPHITYDKKNPKPTNGRPVYHSKPADRFREVTKDFYNDPNGGLPFKDKFFKLKKDGTVDYRRINDHYDTLCRDVIEDISTGNQSGKEGDLSEVYKLVQSLTKDADEAEALKAGDKKEGVELKERLDTTVDQVINGKKNNANKNTAVKIKMADGSIVIDAEREAKRLKAMGNTLDGKLVQFLETAMAKNDSAIDQQAAAIENILVQMKQYILFKGHCLEAFLFEAFSLTTNRVPPGDLQEKINDMGGLDMLIECYCARDDNFEPTKFKNLMSDFEIPAREARIMHVRLDKWRKDAVALATEQEQLTHKKSKARKTGDGVSDLTDTTTDNFTPLPLQQQSQEEEEPLLVEDIGDNHELQGNLGILASVALHND